MHTNESAENYLETILILSKSHPVVRSVDVASELGFKKSSVSVAMKKLRETDQITVSPEGYLYLTETGRATAENPVLLPQRKSTNVIFSFLNGWKSLVSIRSLQQTMPARSSM